MLEDVHIEIEKLVIPIFEEADIQLVDLKVKYYQKTFMIDVRADRHDGGITMDVVAELNKKIIEECEGLDILGEDYTVEVSSPGIDFPLMTEKDFKRVLNKKVRFHLLEKVENKVEHLGVITEVKEKSVVIKNKKDQMVEITFGVISKAIQSID